MRLTRTTSATTMTKHVLSVGQCVPDTSALTSFLQSHFDVDVSSSDVADDTLAALRSGAFDLVLINRKLDRDYSDGIDIVRSMKADSALAEIPVMLVTNFGEHQDAAVEAGAERGFGKNDYRNPDAVERLTPFLG